MPRRTEILAEKIRPYHVVARGINGERIFQDDEDKDRFLLQLYASNIGSPGANLHRRNIRAVAEQILQGEQLEEGVVEQKHKPLVTLFSFVLGRNHYHLGLVPSESGAIEKFMQKLNNGFAKHYNLRHQRKGALFEGRFRAAALQNPQQLDAAIRFISVKNVLDIHQPNWVGEGIWDKKEVRNFLSEYPYSSFPDLFHSRNSLLLPESGRHNLRKILGERYFSDPHRYIETLPDFLREQQGFKRIFLE